MSDNLNILDTLAAIDALADDASIPANLYADLVTYGTPDRHLFGRIAYAITTRKVDGVKGDTLTAYAESTSLKRASLSQWSTAVGYLVKSSTAVTATSFGLASGAYNVGADARKTVRESLAAIAALPTDAKRVAEWRRLLAAVKRDAKSAPAPTEPTESTESESTESTETRAPQVPDGADIGERTASFVNDLRSLAARAGKGDETFIAPNNDQAREIENLLDLIRSHVVEYVSA
jgi:hypothetical protein